MGDNMKRGLVITDIFPFPPVTGGMLRDANIIIQLSKYYKVDLVTYDDEYVSDDRVGTAKLYCNDVHIFNDVHKSIIGRLGNIFRNKCDAEYRIYNQKMCDAVSELVDQKLYDFIFVERLYTYQFLETIVSKNNKVIVDMHDVEREAVGYFKKIERNAVKKARYYVEYRKVRSLEEKVVRSCEMMTFVSKRDQEKYSEWFPDYHYKFAVINNGVDLKKPEQTEVCERDRNLVIFVGSLKHPPNLHGLRWFVTNVWPIIKVKYNGAKFEIIGSGKISDSDREIFTREGIDYLGFVENVFPYLRKASCMVVPLFSGSGTRLKILEAFSFNLPVVSTTIGATGLNCEDENELLIRDEKVGFAYGVLKLMLNEQYSKQMALRGYDKAKKEYDWDIIGEQMSKTIDLLVSDLKR